MYQLLLLLKDTFTELNILRYITFRAICAFTVTFILTVSVMPAFIKWLRGLGVNGQPIRDDGPKDHFSKKGTPTMGGIVMVGAVTISSLLFCDLRNHYVWLSIFVLVSYTALGFLDDWSKVKKQTAEGISERHKLLFQFAVAFLVTLILLWSGFSTELSIPFVKKEVSIPLGIIFIPFAMLVIVGTSNATNLTDGLDGLAIGPIITICATYGLFSYLAGHKELAEYLGVYHVSGAGELSIIMASVCAAGLGFLWYNCSPAQIFMGDTGSLSLGGLLGFIAVLTKHELVLVIAGGVLVVEAMSVIIQRYYYKITKKRIFKMAPIHHHFELLGWPEQKIVIRFWIISIFLSLITLSTLKIR